MRADLHLGDCLDWLRTLPDASVDAVVTDPPGALHFMGREWDSDRGGRAAWVAWLSERLAECLRVARPGARMLCWAIPRTSHWTGTAIEDAGWLIEDRISHMFGTGFPKAKSKLKPAVEDWWLARKPGGKVPELNVDACRIGAAADDYDHPGNDNRAKTTHCYRDFEREGRQAPPHPAGRYPANLTLDEAAAAMLDEQAGERKGMPISRHRRGARSGNAVGYGGNPTVHDVGVNGYGDTGGASRFFYVSKASKADRGPDNAHPTVKSTDLMRWLIRLIASPGSVVLDPFAGSGSTGKAAVMEGCDFLGCEVDPESHGTAQGRIDDAVAAMPLLAAMP